MQLCLWTNRNVLTSVYGKCPKISYTKVSEKTAHVNTADPDQTVSEGAVE